MLTPRTLLFFSLAAPTFAASVTTASYSNLRQSSNTTEAVLRTQVIQNHFGKLGTWTVDGFVWGQPLIVDGVSIGGATTVMLVATDMNKVYLFDANHPGTSPLWLRSFGAGFTGYPPNNAFYSRAIGCTATPVIDENTQVAYLVCPNSAGEWFLHALNLADGTDFFAPVQVAGTNNGVTFVAQDHVMRAALTLLSGVIYFNAASYGDIDPFQGWAFGYDAAMGTQTAIWCVTNTSNGEGGLWWSGGGMASDGTDIFVSTGNGTYDGSANLGSSFVRLDATLVPEDSGTPADFAAINAADHDIDAGKVFMVGNWLIGGGKDGRIFVFDKANLGQLQGVGPGPHQLFSAQNGAIFGCTAFSNNSLILGALNTTLKRFSFDSGSGLFTESPVAVGDGPYPNPGLNCTVSVNAANTNTAILWGVTPSASAFSTVRAGTLRALDGNSLTEIWNSGTVPADALGNYAKFAMVTVVNGKVYVPTFSGQVSLYGVLPVTSTVKLSGTVGVSGAVTVH